MNRRWRGRTLLLAALPALTCASCASFDPRPPSASASSPCASILKSVPAPPINEGDDLRASTARTRAALAKANRELAAGRNCLYRASKE